MCVFKFACTCATTSSIPNLLLSRRSSFLNSAVSSWMLPDFAHIHKNFDRLSKLISCNVITLSPFPSKIFSKTADTSQTCINTKSQPFLVKYGCQIKLVQLVECHARKLGFVLGVWIFGVILSSEFSHSQQRSRNCVSHPGKISMMCSTSGSCNFVHSTMFLLCLLATFSMPNPL